MFKVSLYISLMLSNLCMLWAYSAVSYSAQDPTQPPSWMAPSTTKIIPGDILTLQQILISKDRKIAIINEKIVSEGDVISGAKVINIDPDWVNLLRSGRRITLRLVPTIKEYFNE